MSSNNRRKLIKVLGGSAAMVPVVWTSPAVKSVVLPAHAQATTCAVVAELPETGIDEIALAIFDSDFEPISGLNDGTTSPLTVSAPDLAPGTYYVTVGHGGESEITVNLTTCSNTCSATQIVSAGGSNGCGNAMIRFEIPSGECEEVDITFAC